MYSFTILKNYADNHQESDLTEWILTFIQVIEFESRWILELRLNIRSLFFNPFYLYIYKKIILMNISSQLYNHPFITLHVFRAVDSSNSKGQKYICIYLIYIYLDKILCLTNYWLQQSEKSRVHLHILDLHLLGQNIHCNHDITLSL